VGVAVGASVSMTSKLTNSSLSATAARRWSDPRSSLLSSANAQLLAVAAYALSDTVRLDAAKNTTRGKLIPYSEVQKHSSPDDCWVVLNDKVYDLTNVRYRPICVTNSTSVCRDPPRRHGAHLPRRRPRRDGNLYPPALGGHH
jgi:hypothetical protein